MDYTSNDTILDLINFLEYLDCYENEIRYDGWVYPDRTHEETARRYCASRRGEEYNG